MSGRSSKAKGTRFERKMAHQLREVGLEAKRCPQFRGNADGPDVLVDMPQGGRLLIEVKHHKKVRWRGAYEQAKEYPRLPGDLFAACCKDDRNDEVWIVPAELMELFFEMLKEREC